MEITQNLIQKFFENKCDPDEGAAVLKYLEDHPQEAGRYLGIQEWNDIDPLTPVPEHQQAEMLQQLNAQLFPQSDASAPSGVSASAGVSAPSGVSAPLGVSDLSGISDLSNVLALSGVSAGTPSDAALPVARLSGKTIRFFRIAVAASFLLAIAGIWWIRSENRTSGNTSHSIAQQAGDKNGGSAPVWIARANHSGKPLIIQLPDGSSVKLYDHSTLRYSDSFGIIKRDSWLEGEAVFTVAKDRNKPFTVFSGPLATTALGTAFSAKSGRGVVMVKLFTGRVVVKSTGTLSGWNKDIYLSPGQQVRYDDDHMLATVGRFITPASGSAVKEEEKEGQDLVFNNSSLKEVMDRLSIQYHRKIQYRTTDLKGLNFTGTVSPTDSLGGFLKLLGAMNNLDIQEQPPVFIISRHKN